jgi:hypothetical protein
MSRLCDGICEPGGGWKAPLCDLGALPGGWDRCCYTHL